MIINATTTTTIIIVIMTATTIINMFVLLVAAQTEACGAVQGNHGQNVQAFAPSFPVDDSTESESTGFRLKMETSLGCGVYIKRSSARSCDDAGSAQLVSKTPKELTHLVKRLVLEWILEAHLNPSKSNIHCYNLQLQLNLIHFVDEDWYQ